MERHYPGDMSDSEWALLEPFIIDPAVPRKRGRCEVARAGATLSQRHAPSAQDRLPVAHAAQRVCAAHYCA